MFILDIMFGKAIETSDERGERVGVSGGISIFGLDALSSAAYGPEAALTLLIPLGLAGVAYIVPVSAGIIALLTIVYFSYRQTIAAYPGGGGSYTVASENLGTYPGLIAAAALMLDYTLTAADAGSRTFSGCITGIPAAVAAFFTGENDTSCPRPRGRSGCVYTPKISNSDCASKCFREGTANCGVPQKTKRILLTAGTPGSAPQLPLALFAHLLDLPPDQVALQHAQVLEKQNAVQVIDLVAKGTSQQVFAANLKCVAF